jgi:predicted PurR-regulated permease PerM
LINQISALVKNITSYLLNFKTTGQQNNLYSRVLDYLLNNVDLSKYVSSGGSTLLTLLSNIGTVGLYIFLSLILSLLFMIEKKNVGKFVGRFKQSKLYWMYEDIRYFFKKFARSFGKVIQNQILIAFINAAISVVILMILGFHNYLGLGLMVFILGMVPVAGVIVSLIPLSIIAYSSGGLTKVIYVLILIAVLHSLETYVLNPKLMSRTSKMPVFCTLLVLLISEHFLGIWGLIVGLPLTMFILDVLDVIPSD